MDHHTDGTTAETREAGTVAIEHRVDVRQAKCRSAGRLTALFFADGLDDIATARALCAECTQQAPCLAGAISRREVAGVWGGQLFMNGRILANKRRPGRPRKTDLAESA